ncbi:zinc-ribbon domain-containing protein [Thermodesulfobacteriota bacterium]
MIIKCEECESEFNLDESLLNEDGSRLRCSVCKNVFIAFPPEPESIEEPSEDAPRNVELEETVALDSPPDFDGIELELSDEDKEDAFDKAFEDALEEAPAEPAWAKEDSAEIPGTGAEADLAAPSISPATKRAGRSKILLIIFIIILLFIVGALAVFFLAPDILPDSLSSMKPVKKEAIVDTGIRRLSFKGVSGSFLQTNKSGQFFVIKGTVFNNNPKSRSFILLKGAILDNSGKKIRQNLVYAGNTFDDKQLKEKSIEEIDRGLKNQAGKGNTNVNVKPGSSVPFMIVFKNLPNNLSEFEVEAVSSSPGK